MALVECEDCGRSVSDKASACPGCGCPIGVSSSKSSAESSVLKTCPDCLHGVIEVECTQCRGGFSRCELCEGEGKTWEFDYSGNTPTTTKMTCSACHGAGEIRCHSCNGIPIRREKCVTCAGTGQLTAQALADLLKKRDDAAKECARRVEQARIDREQKAAADAAAQEKQRQQGEAESLKTAEQTALKRQQKESRDIKVVLFGMLCVCLIFGFNYVKYLNSQEHNWIESAGTWGLTVDDRPLGWCSTFGNQSGVAITSIGLYTAAYNANINSYPAPALITKINGRTVNSATEFYKLTDDRLPAKTLNASIYWIDSKHISHTRTYQLIKNAKSFFSFNPDRLPRVGEYKYLVEWQYLNACYKDNERIIRNLQNLGVCPATVAMNTRHSPVCFAATTGNKRLLGLLLQGAIRNDPYKGPDVVTEFDETTWETPLTCAIHNNHPDIVHYLLARGEVPDKSGHAGAYPLQLAAANDDISEVRDLLSHGSRTRGMQPDPVDIATSHGNYGIARLLRSRH